MEMRINKVGILIMVLLSITGSPTGPSQHNHKIYYVSASGNDNNDGLSSDTPIKSISKVNSLYLLPGDEVLFKRGDIWFRNNSEIKTGVDWNDGDPTNLATLDAESGNSTDYITYSNYGNLTDPLPVLTMAIDVGESSLWTNQGSNLWSTPANADVGNVMFNNKTSVGWKKWYLSNLTHQGDYFWDESSNSLKMYSILNPGTYYYDIIISLRPDIAMSWGASYIIFDGIHFSMSGGEGIVFGDSHDIIVRNSIASWIGGSQQSPTLGNLRFGNAIEFWEGAYNTSVYNNKIFQIYDEGLSSEGDSDAGPKYNQFFYNNSIWDTEWGMYFVNHNGNINNIHIENNLFYNGGGSWAHEQRDDPMGGGLWIANTNGGQSNVYVTNNQFLEGTQSLLFIGKNGISGLTLDYNIYANSQKSTETGEANFALFPNNGPTYDDWFTMSQFPIWKSITGEDEHSMIISNPTVASATTASATTSSHVLK